MTLHVADPVTDAARFALVPAGGDAIGYARRNAVRNAAALHVADPIGDAVAVYATDPGSCATALGNAEAVGHTVTLDAADAVALTKALRNPATVYVALANRNRAGVDFGDAV